MLKRLEDSNLKPQEVYIGYIHFVIDELLGIKVALLDFKNFFFWFLKDDLVY